jgi:integrase
MASLHRRNGSHIWHCSFRDSGGRWRLRSTGCRDKGEAEAVCARFEALARQTGKDAGAVPAPQTGELMEAGLSLIQEAKAGRLTEAAARAYCDRVLKASGSAEGLPSESFQAYAENWLAGVDLSKAKRTGQRYGATMSFFLSGIGKKADGPIAAITARDVERFRDARLREVGPTTARHDVKIVRTLFNRARRQGLISVNPAEAVDVPTDAAKKREPFTVAEVAGLVKAAPEEWRTVILLGFYAGLRLGDAAKLTWARVDLSAGVLRFKAQKTGRGETVPLHPVLQKHLERIAGDESGAISPALAQQVISGRSGLSRQFLSITREAGLDSGAEAEKPGGKRRRFTARTFHSLRHGFVSELANRGVSKELRMKLAGHTTEAVADGYTHHETETLRAAVNLIPKA